MDEEARRKDRELRIGGLESKNSMILERRMRGIETPRIVDLGLDILDIFRLLDPQDFKAQDFK